MSSNKTHFPVPKDIKEAADKFKKENPETAHAIAAAIIIEDTLLAAEGEENLLNDPCWSQECGTAWDLQDYINQHIKKEE